MLSAYFGATPSSVHRASSCPAASGSDCGGRGRARRGGERAQGSGKEMRLKTELGISVDLGHAYFGCDAVDLGVFGQAYFGISGVKRGRPCTGQRDGVRTMLESPSGPLAHET